MMSLTFGLFTQVSGSGPLGSLVLFYYVCVSQSSFYMNFKLNELFYNTFLMF